MKYYLLLPIFILGSVLYNPQIIETAEIPPIVYKSPKKETKTEVSIFCSCIETARAEGVDIPIGTNAGDLKPNSLPVIGALILLKYKNADHVAKILEFKAEGFLVVEGNFKPCQRGTRIVYYIDSFIRGFWIPET